MWLLMSSIIMGAWAQQLIEGESAIIYYMPQTELEVELQYTVESHKPGILFAFAEDKLGITDAIEDSDTIYQLQGASIYTRTYADHNRSYKVTDQQITPLLTLSDKGILAAYNATVPAKSKNKKQAETPAKAVCAPRHHVMPLSEEQIGAASLTEMANLIAKQIYRIRETRMFLLEGEIDAPKDGKSLELILNELRQQESALVTLFSGESSVEEKNLSLRYLPTVSDTILLGYFDSLTGELTHEEEGELLRLVIQAEQPVVEPQPVVEDKHAKKQVVVVPELYYNLPALATIQVWANERLLATKRVQIAQMGVSVPVPAALTRKGEEHHILFDTQTGNIQSISK